MLPRAALLLLCTTHASSWFASKKEKQPKTKPNILVLLADDHSAEALGYRGKATVAKATSRPARTCRRTV